MASTPSALAARLTATALVLCAAHASAETRWTALVVGANTGDQKVQPLRYAENDAAKMAALFLELGTVARDDLFELYQPTLAELEAAVLEVRTRNARLHQTAGDTVALAFYFSGHSDGEALELGHERVSWADLRAMLAGAGADVRFIVVDACKSGAAVRSKGGTAAESFPILIDHRQGLDGEVIITSASATESAFESGELQGSYFTHHLASALRGAGDVNGDRRVTITEAYRHAFDHTVQATEVLASGGQHPAYHYRLSGEGELVLTELSGGLVSLKLPGATQVRVKDASSHRVLLEMNGPQHEVKVSPGLWQVEAMRGGKRFAAQLDVTAGSSRVVGWGELSTVVLEKAPVPGAPTIERCRARGPSRPWVVARRATR